MFEVHVGRVPQCGCDLLNPTPGTMSGRALAYRTSFAFAYRTSFALAYRTSFAFAYRTSFAFAYRTSFASSGSSVWNSSPENENVKVCAARF